MGGPVAAVRVLLVEDERASALLVERRLESIATVRCTVDHASCIAEALDRLQRGRYDLVITDLHLPDSPAADTVSTLVQACRQPVIALTVDEDPELRAKAVADGA